jgi:hypothetical protein
LFPSDDAVDRAPADRERIARPAMRSQTIPLLRNTVVRSLKGLKWLLWHGDIYKASQVVHCVEMDFDAAVATSGHATARTLPKAMEEFHDLMASNRGFIPDYGERCRHGERISTGFVELTVNQVISKRFCARQQTQ